MTRKHVAPHAKRLQKQQERHRKKVWQTFKKLARHKACYEAPKGGYMVFGAGFKGRAKKGGYMLYGAGVRKGGMMLRGAGVRKAGYKKKTIKLPAWVNKPIPRSGWPKVPKGFSKSGGAFWNSHSKKAQQVQAKAKSYLGRIWAKGKETVGKLGSAAASTIKKHASRLADQGMQFLADHQDQFVDMAGKYMDAQAAKAAGKASATMDKYAAKGKKGSGLSGIERTKARIDQLMTPAKQQRIMAKVRQDRASSIAKWGARQQQMRNFKLPAAVANYLKK